MAAERSSSAHSSAVAPGPRSITLLCFAIIYFVWGSTFLAIRVGVREVPPLVLAAMRFVAAGAFLVAWTRMRGEKFPTAREWRTASLLGIIIFLFDYGLLFWSEKRVPSGLAAVMLGTIPVFMALFEIIFLKTQKFTLGLALGLLTGLCGVAVLMSPALHLGGAPVDRLGAAALLFASVSWSVASVIARKAPLPESKVMSSGAQMLTGGIFLAFTAAASGELRGFQVASVSREAWLALLYLIIAGSIIGFTAYVWLLHHESPTKVGTYAYVNPIVAVIVGYFFGGEALTARTIVGSACVLLSVILITVAASRKKSAIAPALERRPAIADAD
jgi:drug/metabolite transporter (DMT)-like permease